MENWRSVLDAQYSIEQRGYLGSYAYVVGRSSTGVRHAPCSYHQSGFFSPSCVAEGMFHRTIDPICWFNFLFLDTFYTWRDTAVPHCLLFTNYLSVILSAWLHHSNWNAVNKRSSVYLVTLLIVSFLIRSSSG